MENHAFVAVFSAYLSMYKIAIIGIYPYIRIKHYVNFKILWTKKVVSTLILIEVFFLYSKQ